MIFPRGQTNQFQPNNSSSNDDHFLGDLFEREGSSGRDDRVFVDGDAWEGGNFRASRDEDVPGSDVLCGAVVLLHGDLVGACDRAVTHHMAHFVRFEQHCNSWKVMNFQFWEKKKKERKQEICTPTSSECLDRRIFGGHEILHVERHARDIDSCNSSWALHLPPPSNTPYLDS